VKPVVKRFAPTIVHIDGALVNEYASKKVPPFLPKNPFHFQKVAKPGMQTTYRNDAFNYGGSLVG